MDKFAVIDTETNWNDQVMSIGVVIADSKTMKEIDSVYYIIDPEYRVGGMYESELRPKEKGVRITDRRKALGEIRKWLYTYNIRKLFAYNASFDKKHLPEYREYEWYDIMRLAACRLEAICRIRYRAVILTVCRQTHNIIPLIPCIFRQMSLVK